MDKFKSISASRWAVTGIAVVAVLIPPTFGMMAVNASASTTTQATASTTTLYQQEGSGGPISSTGTGTWVALSPYLAPGTYVVEAAADVQLGSLSTITCSIRSSSPGSTVHGSQGSAANLSDNGIPSEDANIALSATVVLTNPANRIQLSCIAGSNTVSVVNYSVTEQAVAKLILN